jgi:hypothetical protein
VGFRFKLELELENENKLRSATELKRPDSGNATLAFFKTRLMSGQVAGMPDAIRVTQHSAIAQILKDAPSSINICVSCAGHVIMDGIKLIKLTSWIL